MKYLHTDHYSAIGYQHLSDGKPCQDHTLSGFFKENGETALAYAVVSDGCSSGGETDIGARLLTTVSAKHFRGLQIVHGDISVEDEVGGAAAILDLKDEDLLATHLYAQVDVNGEGSVVIKGDGVVVLIDRAGLLTIYRYEWAKNLPYYPMHNGLDAFYKAHGGKDAEALRVTLWLLPPQGDIVKVAETMHTVEEGCKGMRLPIVAADDLSAICLFSDGICQIDKLDWLEAIKQITDFRDRKGVFVKRRMNFFIKDMMKLGHGPLDDISIAVISMQDIYDMPDLDPLFDDESPDLRHDARTLGDTWLTDPNLRLGGKTPEEVINEGHGARVREIIRSVWYVGIS